MSFLVNHVERASDISCGFCSITSLAYWVEFILICSCNNYGKINVEYENE